MLSTQPFASFDCIFDYKIKKPSCYTRKKKNSTGPLKPATVCATFSPCQIKTRFTNGGLDGPTAKCYLHEIKNKKVLTVFC